MMRAQTEDGIIAALDLALMPVVTGLLPGLLAAFIATGCRKPPTDPIPADAAPIAIDAGPEDAGPAVDGSVSDCVSLPNLTCAKLSQEAAKAGLAWEEGKDTAIDSVRAQLKFALQHSGGLPCGQAGGVVHYLGDDTQVELVFKDTMDGWEASETVENPACVTRQSYTKDGVRIWLGTRRAQGSFFLSVESVE